VRIKFPITVKSGYQEDILQATGNRGVDVVPEMLANGNLSHDRKPLSDNARVIVIGRRSPRSTADSTAE